MNSKEIEKIRLYFESFSLITKLNDKEMVEKLIDSHKFLREKNSEYRKLLNKIYNRNYIQKLIAKIFYL